MKTALPQTYCPFCECDPCQCKNDTGEREITMTPRELYEAINRATRILKQLRNHQAALRMAARRDAGQS